MRTFIITKGGFARVMRTYALNESGSVIIGGTDGPDANIEIAKWSQQNRLEVTAFREIDEADIPVIYQFKDAWFDTGSSIDVDMPKARVLHMNRIRLARDTELERQDIEFTKAEDDNDMPLVASIRSRRRSLRGIPETFDLSGAATPEELDALWPGGLDRD